MKKKLFVLNVDDYRPDLTVYTLPTIKAYAESIGAAFELIDVRIWKSWPVTYEKLQVYTRGAGCRWNILIDADTMIHPDMPDVTGGDPAVVRFAYGHDMRANFEPNIYFERCGHHQAIAGGFVVTSHLTHDLWRPLPMRRTTALRQTKRKFIIDEYAMTYNLAKYGLQYSGIMPGDKIDSYAVHLGNEERTPDQRAGDVVKAAELFKNWGFA